VRNFFENLMESEHALKSQDGPSKNAQKKQEKKQKKEQLKADLKAKAVQQQTKQNTVDLEDVSVGNYGTFPLIQSSSRPGRVFARIESLDEKRSNEHILVRGRLHALRAKGNICFLVIRQRFSTIQGILLKGKEISKQMLNFVSGIPKESIIDVEGTLLNAKELIESTSQRTVEILISKVFVVTTSISGLPLLLEDASRPKSVLIEQEKRMMEFDRQIIELQEKLKGKEDTAEGKELASTIQILQEKKSNAQSYVKVSRETRLNNRVLDLRTPANQAIFIIQSGVCQLFREYLLSQQFMEIHSPKLIGCASEGGANVFKVQYFNTSAFLAQSPQLYKQMSICADMERVFEIGPIFRAENSNTHRHLTEFVGLDMEMAFNEHYHEVLDLLGDLFVFIFEGLQTRYAKQLESVNQQFPFQPLKFLKPSLRMNYSEAVAMLRGAGVPMGDFEDLSTENEKVLGKLVREKYDTDFYILDKFPKVVRPFYTMPDPNDANYSNSYDFFLRGEEIMSGAQRIHDPDLLSHRAQECGVGLDGIKDYVNSFRYGVLPHAGGGIGLERVVMLYLNLKNIRMCSMFPRDPSRISP